MRLKFLFWILVVIVFGSLAGIGFMFLKTDFRMFVAVEGLSILALILFILLYNKLIKPYNLIINGMELLNEQDFSSRLRPIPYSEANKLIEVFNKMMEQLKNERLQVREKNHFLDLLIQASPQGVIILDFDRKITEINPAGIKLLNIKEPEKIMGKTLEESGINIGESLAKLEPEQDTVIRSSGITMFRCVRSSFIDRGFSHPFILIEEMTGELLKIEKKAYENIIRMMAHEVNNSIGAVSSTLHVISDILKQDAGNELQDVVPAVEASSERCRHLGRFISNFAEVVKIPEPTCSKTDINELVRSVSALTLPECNKRNISMDLILSSDKCSAYIDSIQFEQVLVNIVKNACESIGEEGNIKIRTSSHPLSIVVEDNGPGITQEVKEKIFTPFFTTKSKGQGIGLIFVKEVLLNHKCKFDLKTENGSTKFEIYFN